MNYFKFSLIILIGFTLFFSCKKEEDNNDDATVQKNPPAASFTYNLNKRTISCYSNSTNSPDSLHWNLGDNTEMFGDSVTHEYESGGTYRILLSAFNSDGNDTFSLIVIIDEYYELIEIKTDLGNLTVWLYDETPKHKANFLMLADSGFYDTTTFHRIIQDFVIQGGDPLSKDTDPNNDGTGGPGYTIEAEFDSSLTHVYGAIASARQGDNVNPDKRSSGSQFYIVVNANGTHNLDMNYTTFGIVIDGMDASDKISIQPKDSNDRPISDIVMIVEVVLYSQQELITNFNFDPEG